MERGSGVRLDGRAAPAAGRASLEGRLRRLGTELGLEGVGIATAEAFRDTRSDLEGRKRRGLHGGMWFTYGNPARSTDPGRALPGARSLVVGARSYRRAGAVAGSASLRRSDDPAAGDDRSEGSGPFGSVARYSWRDHYVPLREALSALGGLLAKEGWRAKVLVDDNALVDRAAAHRAGLGWYGKNTLLLLPGRGSWYVLGSVVTDAPLRRSASVPVADGCGSCSRCLSACPTGALVAPGVLDARRCLAWLLEAPGWFPLEHRRALGGRVYGCDDCQEVCPVNKLADRRDPPPPPGSDEEPWVDLVWMLGLSDDQLLEHFGRWYVPRREARYLRRNALVALGNVGRPDDLRVQGALEASLGHADPVVRGHAAWAARNLGRGDLLDPLVGREQDERVRAELTTPASP